jgi:hypothetical protein
MKKLLGCFLCLMLLAFGAQAHALSITPATSPMWSGNDTSQSVIDGIIGPIISPAVLLYNADPSSGESGALAGSYSTAFNGDLSGATISYDGGDWVGPPSYLLVKDGNHAPAWYLFDLGPNPPITGLDWNGKDDLVLSGFWPDGGAISHVTLYGTQSVPEPMTMLLLGSGIFGLALFGRGRKTFKR